MAIRLSILATPIGKLHLLADDQILIGASFNPIKRSGIETVSKLPVITDLIKDYFDGDLNAINGIKVAQPGGAFSQAAWKAMRKVKGTISYAELAKRAGSPAAVRAAGSACASNAVVLVVPCHRIVKTGGALGNYAYGLSKKEWLLSHEGAL